MDMAMVMGMGIQMMMQEKSGGNFLKKLIIKNGRNY